MPATDAKVNTPQQLRHDLAEQDRRFARAFALLPEACRADNNDRAFPGAVIAVTHRSALVALKAFGRFTFEHDSPVVAEDTVFDLASVTKVVATTAMAMLLVERGTLSLDQPVYELLPEFETGDSARRRVTVRMLLTHSSGLPAYVKLFLTARSREELISVAATTPLEAAPLARAVYSDIGFILLGEILTRTAGEPIDRFCQHEIFGPLGMPSTTFHPQQPFAIPPTQADCELRHRLIQGEVNDENASVMGGVAGHAGLFANALDIARFAECLLHGGAPILRAETVRLFTTRDASTPGTSRALGWDTPSAPSQSGQHFGPRSFGHLGFTGTSLWCDPDRQLSVTLLTNRTWPDRVSQQIKRVRPMVHDAVVEAVDA
jgi:CubicO group peptidase (beta-lactamase class C family)